MNKEMFIETLQDKRVINCRTEQEAAKFIKLANSFGIEWTSNARKKTYFEKYKKDTCYRIFVGNELVYCSKDYFVEKGYQIITYPDFMALGDPKPKFKVGDKVVDNVGDIYVIRNIRFGYGLTKTNGVFAGTDYESNLKLYTEPQKKFYFNRDKYIAEQARKGDSWENIANSLEFWANDLNGKEVYFVDKEFVKSYIDGQPLSKKWCDER